MGCDIHTIAEIKLRGEWKPVGRIFPDSYYSEDRPTFIDQYDEDDEEYEYNSMVTSQPYKGRNYDLFAILADVRNGRGFAGIVTGTRFNPIDEPRGIPEDADFYTKKFLNHYESDGHSHSYFTLDELKNYDWNQANKHYGVVNIDEYKQFKEFGKPASWCGAVDGLGVKHITNEEMDLLVDLGVKSKRFGDGNENDPSFYTSVEWTEPYFDSTKEFQEKTIPQLEKLLSWKDVEDVRLLFFFDN